MITPRKILNRLSEKDIFGDNVKMFVFIKEKNKEVGFLYQIKWINDSDFD